MTTPKVEPYCYTVLIRFAADQPAPRVGAGMEVWGGDVLGVCFADQFAAFDDMEARAEQAEAALEEAVGLLRALHPVFCAAIAGGGGATDTVRTLDVYSNVCAFLTKHKEGK